MSATRQEIAGCKLINTMGLETDPETTPSRILGVAIGLIDLPTPQKLTSNGCVCGGCLERQQLVLRAVFPAQEAVQLYGAP